MGVQSSLSMSLAKTKRKPKDINFEFRFFHLFSGGQQKKRQKRKTEEKTPKQKSKRNKQTNSKQTLPLLKTKSLLSSIVSTRNPHARTHARQKNQIKSTKPFIDSLTNHISIPSKKIIREPS